MADERYDAIVIGSGVGGLACAVFLAKAGGKKVLVLEKHLVPGGLTQQFTRPGGYEFGVGLHYVGAMGPGDQGRAVTDFLSEGALRWHALPDPYDVLVYPDFRFEVPVGRDAYRAKLQETFPDEAKAIARYFEDIERTARYVGEHLAIKGMPGWLATLRRLFGRGGKELATTTTKEYLDRTFEDPRLRAVIASQWPGYGLPPGESSFGIHALVTSSFYGGGHHPIGGTKSIAESSLAVLRSHGGECLVNREVREILVEDGRAVGVQARDPRAPERSLETLRADVVISDVGAVPTYLELVPEEVELPFRQEIRDFPHGHSSVVAYVGLTESPETLGMRGENYWLYTGLDHDETWLEAGALLAGEPSHAFVSFGSLHDPETKAHTVQIISGCDYESFERWQETHWRERPDDYEALKETVGRGLIAFADRHIPGLADLVGFVEVSTPLTVEHFTGHPFGAYYGVPAVPQKWQVPWLDPKTPVEGLYLTGTDVGTPGIMGAAIGGLVTAGRVLGIRGFGKVMEPLRGAR